MVHQGGLKSNTRAAVLSLRTWFLPAAVATLLLQPTAAHGQALYRLASFDYLAQRAGVIVQGRVLESRYEPLPGYPNISTVRVTLQVERMLRGPEEETYTFRQHLLPNERRAGKPHYQAGERLLLFLPAPSAAGLSKPLGGEQGLFRIARDASGNDVVANAFGNSRLFRNLPDAAAQAGVSLSPRELKAIAAERRPVELDVFISLIQKFSEGVRSE
jgi:hypothetical protein